MTGLAPLCKKKAAIWVESRDCQRLSRLREFLVLSSVVFIRRMVRGAGMQCLHKIRKWFLWRQCLVDFVRRSVSTRVVRLCSFWQPGVSAVVAAITASICLEGGSARQTCVLRRRYEPRGGVRRVRDNGFATMQTKIIRRLYLDSASDVVQRRCGGLSLREFYVLWS